MNQQEVLKDIILTCDVLVSKAKVFQTKEISKTGLKDLEKIDKLLSKAQGILIDNIELFRFIVIVWKKRLIER